MRPTHTRLSPAALLLALAALTLGILTMLDAAAARVEGLAATGALRPF